ncbi:FAD-dependent oxidoreductase [Paenibacillus taichungensis]
MIKQKIVIIGAGIVGAAMAYHLAKRNQDVTVIERHPDAAREVTEKSFAWIHTTHRVAPDYWHLYDASLEEYHTLQQELPELKIHWHGALTWDTPPLREQPHFQKLNREQLEVLEPNLLDYPDEAMYVSEESAVDPIEITELLLNKAREYGAKFSSIPTLHSFSKKVPAWSACIRPTVFWSRMSSYWPQVQASPNFATR